MSKFLITLAIAVISLAFACAEGAKTSGVANNGAAPSVAKTADVPSPTPDDVPRISLTDAKKDYDGGTAVIVDVRNETDYLQEHIKGALNITVADLDAKADKLPKGKKIIAYCS